tara:strand:+ start:25141 stop:26832 length:1692 start_codon:yes stop_codon:yes gene_type:complete
MKKTILIFFSTIACFLCYGQQDIGKSTDEYFKRTEPLGFSGAIIISKDGETILNEGYGYANREIQKKNTSNSVFSTGSVTKQFTAAAIMKLEMMGKLKTDDKISKYFENVPNVKSEIKIHNLLTHTSGLTGALADDFDEISKEKYLNQALNSKLEFNPSENFNYSNVGYSLLAMIIEKQSGISYEEFLNKYLFTPSGMNQTGYKLPDWNESNFVQIYNGSKNNGSTEIFTNPTWHLIGNGGILSTTSDMIKWVKALNTEKILSNKIKEKMFTPYRNDYGYGWDVLDDGALRQHNGGSTLGLGAELRWFVQDKVVTMIFTNATINGDLGFNVVRGDLEALAMGDNIPLPPKFSTVKADTKFLVGTYQLPSGQQFQIQNNSEYAVLLIDNQELLDLISDPKNYSPNSPSIVLNKKFHEAFDKAFSNNDYSGFSFTGASKELENEIKNEIKMEGLKNPHFKVVKSFLSKNNKNAYITQIALSEDPDFNNESMLLSIVTENSKYAGLGVDFGFVGPVELTLYPTGKDKFQAYNLSNKMGAIIEITGNNDNYNFIVNGTKVSNIKKIN